MLGLELVSRLRRRQEFSSYSRQLGALLSGDALLRSLPRLRGLPLTVRSSDGRSLEQADLLQVSMRLLVRGDMLVGSLLITQLAQAWMHATEHPTPAPLPIDLAALDDPAGSPHALLTAFLTSAGALHAADEQRWLLLVSGWGALSHERRTAWQRLLVGETLPRTVRLGLVVAPAGAAGWPGFASIDVAVDAVALDSWLPDGRGDLPVAANEGMYRWIQELLLMGHPQLSGSFEREQVVLDMVDAHAAPAPALPGFGFGLRTYLHRRATLLSAARQLVHAEIAALAAHADRDELLPLVAAISARSSDLLRWLWRRRADTAELLLAGRCLAATDEADPAVSLLIVAALAQLARQSTEAAEVCGACLPALDRAITALRARRSRRLIARALAALPTHVAQPRLAMIAYDDQSADALAWACADQLIRLGELDQTPAPAAGAGLVRWVVVRAAAGAQGHLGLGQLPQQALVQTLARMQPERRRVAAAAVVVATQVGALARLSALDLLVKDGADPTLLDQLARDSLRELRVAAHMLLLRDAPAQALRVAIAVLGDRELAWEVRRDALPTMRERRSTAFIRALVGSAADPALPAHVRVEVLQALALQPNARFHLMRVAHGDGHPVLRAAAIHLLEARLARHAPRHTVWLTGQLRRLLDAPALPTSVSAAACGLLGALGGAPAVELLCQVVERAADDPPLTEAAVQALGTAGDPAAVATLEGLLGPDGLLRLQHACPPDLLRAPAGDATSAPHIPPALAQALRAAGDTCLTRAERPTTMSEYLIAAAEGLRHHAAVALVQIGGASARQALSAGIRAGGNGMATPAMIEALAQLCGPADTATMRAVLLDPRVDPRTRWLVAQGVAEHAAALGALLEGITADAIDPFTKGEIAEALGRRRHPGASQLLAELALDPATDHYLRERALVGLGLHGDAYAQGTLLDLACDAQQPADLRGMAAAQIGAGIAPTALQALRNLLRGERASAVLAGVIQALGRAHDRDALPLLLQFCLDDRSELVRAAIDALAQIGDLSVAPSLMRITQRASADRMLRLHALGALLHIGDRDYTPLLQEYLQDGALPVQLQALELLIQAGAMPQDLLGLACDRGRGIPFRMRALQAAAAIGSATVLAELLADRETPEPLRGQAASVLAQIGGSPAEAALLGALLREDDPLAVRLACLAALRERAELSTAAPIAELLARSSSTPTLYEQACRTLISIMMQ
jgi:HEAT repeat protein